MSLYFFGLDAGFLAAPLAGAAFFVDSLLALAGAAFFSAFAGAAFFSAFGLVGGVASTLSAAAAVCAASALAGAAAFSA
jgi:hypothetical protein